MQSDSESATTTTHVVGFDPLGMNLVWPVNPHLMSIADYLRIPDVKAVTLHREQGDFRYRWATEAEVAAGCACGHDGGGSDAHA